MQLVAAITRANAAFRTPFRRRRCLILADGFYEWRKDGAKKTAERMTAYPVSTLVNSVKNDRPECITPA